MLRPLSHCGDHDQQKYSALHWDCGLRHLVRVDDCAAIHLVANKEMRYQN